MIHNPPDREGIGVGTVVTWGDFEVHLDQVLGQGGMGTVYRARQISLDRPVAIKVLDLSRAESPEILEGFLERFQIEAKAVARVHDSRIVSIIQAGRNDERCWIAMELVEGETLEDCLHRGLLEDREAARIAREIAQALDAAWKAGILHRDVKPANVFLCENGAVKLGDWGLARAAQFGRTKLSQTNAVTCTPAYVAPEGAQGQEMDFRADLYSLGCVLYEMVTERPPFQSDSPMELLFRHCNEDPVPPRTLNPNLGHGLEAVILRCLEKKPELRYETYGDFLAALEEAVPRTPVAVRPAPSRLPWVVVVAAIAIIAGVAWMLRSPRPEPPRREPPAAKLSKKPQPAPIPLNREKPPGPEYGIGGRLPSLGATPEPEMIVDPERLELALLLWPNEFGLLQSAPDPSLLQLVHDSLRSISEPERAGETLERRDRAWVRLPLLALTLEKAAWECEDLETVFANHRQTHAAQVRARQFFSSRRGKALSLSPADWKLSPAPRQRKDYRLELADGLVLEDPTASTIIERDGAESGFEIEVEFEAAERAVYHGFFVIFSWTGPMQYRLARISGNQLEILSKSGAGEPAPVASYRIDTGRHRLALIPLGRFILLFVDGKWLHLDSSDLDRRLRLGVQEGRMLLRKVEVFR